jgi:glyoxylase-like metal-dependent hydrolase (beta-lactamase superfamily II)
MNCNNVFKHKEKEVNILLKKPLCFMIALGFMVVFSSSSPQELGPAEVGTVKVTDGVYMLIGNGGNIGVSVGEDGVLLIDSLMPPQYEQVKAAVAGISDGPVRFVINTHFHFDHAGGNELFRKDGAMILGHDNVRKRMQEEWSHWSLGYKIPPFPETALPDATFNDSAILRFNGDEIYALHVENAHTDSDAIIFFKKANVVHMGDLCFAGGYPFIDVPHGGSTEGYISALDKVLNMIDDDTKVIPGHGPLSNRKELQAYRNMLSTVRDRIAEHVEEGKTLEEVLEAKPTADFDEQFSKQMPAEAFVKIVFNDIS